MNLRFMGMRVILNNLLEQDGEPYTVRRTWRERLFTRPWRPHVATRTITPKVPYKGAFQIDANTVVMHPETYHQMTKALDKYGPHMSRYEL